MVRESFRNTKNPNKFSNFSREWSNFNSMCFLPIDNITEGEVLVDPKHHKHFVARRGEVLRRISDDYGGVLISFPRQGMETLYTEHYSVSG